MKSTFFSARWKHCKKQDMHCLGCIVQQVYLGGKKRAIPELFWTEQRILWMRTLPPPSLENHLCREKRGRQKEQTIMLTGEAIQYAWYLLKCSKLDRQQRAVEGGGGERERDKDVAAEWRVTCKNKNITPAAEAVVSTMLNKNILLLTNSKLQAFNFTSWLQSFHLVPLHNSSRDVSIWQVTSINLTDPRNKTHQSAADVTDVSDFRLTGGNVGKRSLCMRVHWWV